MKADVRVLVDGAISRLVKLPGGQLGRVREYGTGRAVYTWNSKGEGKRDVTGRLNGAKTRFVPSSRDDAHDLENFFRRKLAPAKGTMVKVA